MIWGSKSVCGRRCSRSHWSAIIPIRTVARLKIRLRNHRILMRTAVGEGVNAGIVRSCIVVAVPFVLPSICARIRSKRSLATSPESCLSPL